MYNNIMSMKDLCEDYEYKNILQDCENICIDKNKTLWEKLHYLIRRLYTSECAPGFVECPFCGNTLVKQSVKDENSICYIDLDYDNNIHYNIITPCCDRIIFSTEKWYTDNKNELLENTRKRYRESFINAEQAYQDSKRQYQSICDLIYEREQGWKNN